MLFISKYRGYYRYFYLVSLCFVFAGGCKSTEKLKENPGETVYEFHCSASEYLPTIDYFRIHIIGESVDQATSMRKAIHSGQQNLAESIKSVLSRAIENYVSIKGLHIDELMKKQIDSLTEPVGNQAINKVNVICEETIKTLDGLYQTYVVLEISANEVLNEMQKNLLQNTQFQTKIDVSEFKKIFELEMSKQLNKFNEKQI